MRFLSVAERELRASARQKATHRIRWMTAAVFCALLAWLMWAFSGFRAPRLFMDFAILAFFYCLLIGTVRTADCLSSEKREGTMGLLFLTNLNGAEIIGGKLCSSALAAAYGLFAIFPLLALQMLIGGVTLGHFWRIVLALANAIFFSVAAGFLASSLCVRQFTAVASASGLALFFSLGMMGWATAANALGSSKAWVEGLATFSPLYTFIAADGTPVLGRNHYWRSVLTVTGLSWIFLALATWRVSWSWRDRPTGPRSWRDLKIPLGEKGRGAGTIALRRRLLGINPFFWLAGRRLVSAPVFMLLTVVLVAVTCYVSAPYFCGRLRAGTLSPMVGQLMAWLWTGLAIHALVLYYAAMIASRRLAEDKQTGALELVLSTPTSERSISRGLWMAYGRSMFFPATIAILVHCFFIWQGATLAVMDPPSARLPVGTTPGELFWHVLLDRPIGGVRLQWQFAMAARIIVLALVLLILVWFTLGWVGRWLGLRMKYPGFAPMASLALVLVPPVVLFSFACYYADKWNLDRLPGRMFIPMMMWVAFSIGAGQCLLLSLWAAGRLRKDFRTVVTSRFQPPPLRPWWRPTRRGLLRFGATVGGVMAALLVISVSFYGYQNWRSRRAWSAFQKELKQRNESLDLAALLPAAVPERQNFALTPEFRSWTNSFGGNAVAKRLFDNLKQFDTSAVGWGPVTPGIEWTRQTFAPLNTYSIWLVSNTALPKNATRGEFAHAFLQGLEPYEANLRTLAEAAHLPSFQPFTNSGARAVLDPVRAVNVGLERLHMLFQLRAGALLATNRVTEAAEDLLTGLRLVRLARQMPDTQSSTRAQTMLAHSLQPLWEGIVERRWTEAQLAAFQNELSQFNLLADHTNAVRRVVLATIEIWREIPEGTNPRYPLPASTRYVADSIRQKQPRAWWFDNCIQLYQAGETAVAKVDVAGGRVHLRMDWSDLNDLPLANETTSLIQQYCWSGAAPGLVVFAQTAVNQAVIACALERYRLAHGRYPETLEQLIPDYLSRIPNDVVRGRPMLYENPGDGRFTLRSVGPNETDDRKNPVSDDWLWSFPTNAPAAKR